MSVFTEIKSVMIVKIQSEGIIFMKQKIQKMKNVSFEVPGDMVMINGQKSSTPGP